MFFFYKDTAHNFDKTSVESGSGNLSLIHRYNRTQDGDDVMMEEPLFVDLAEMNQYLISRVELRLKLYMNPNNFVLMYSSPTESFHVDISHMSFRCKFIEPTSAVSLLHATALETRSAIYNYTWSVLKIFTIPAGLKTCSLDSLYTDNLPYKIYIGFLYADSYAGDPKKNTYNFQHFFLQFLSFQIEGQNHITFLPDFEKGHYTSEFLGLFENNLYGGIVSYED